MKVVLITDTWPDIKENSFIISQLITEFKKEHRNIFVLTTSETGFGIIQNENGVSVYRVESIPCITTPVFISNANSALKNQIEAEVICLNNPVYPYEFPANAKTVAFWCKTNIEYLKDYFDTYNYHVVFESEVNVDELSIKDREKLSFVTNATDLKEYLIQLK